MQLLIKSLNRQTIILTFLFYSSSFAAFELTGQNAFLNGISNSSVVAGQLFSAFLLNPATSASDRQPGLGLTYFKPYNIADLNHATLVLTFPFHNWGSGLSFYTFGNSIYTENRITLNLSRSFYNNRLSVGFNSHWYNLRVDQYSSPNAISADVGFQYRINSNLIAGFVLRNFSQPKLNNYAEEIPIVTAWGLSYKIDENIDTYLALQKENWFPLNVAFGLDFKAGSVVSFQSGFCTSPAAPALGLRINYSILNIHYAFQYHFELGSTHFWGISFQKP
jgi:hypothetical protein